MRVHFIGAGPGAGDLLTVRAVRLIESSPVCVYAGTYVDAEILAHCPADAELINSASLDLDSITTRLIQAHEEGKDVARLCSGDPSLYSALAEQVRRLDRAGVPWDVTPGVPAGTEGPETGAPVAPLITARFAARTAAKSIFFTCRS